MDLDAGKPPPLPPKKKHSKLLKSYVDLIMLKFIIKKIVDNYCINDKINHLISGQFLTG